MPTLYLRDVPEPLYARLRRRARRNRRSMNAEAIEILQDRLEADRDTEELVERLRRLRFTIPEGVPPPEEVIRRARDERHPGYP